MSEGRPTELNPASEAPSPPWFRFEDSFNLGVLLLMALLPILKLADDKLRFGISGILSYVAALLLLVSMSGAALAAREGRHLTLTILSDRLGRKTREISEALATGVAVSVVIGLVWGAVVTVEAMVASTQTLAGGIPYWVVLALVPAGLSVVGVRLVLAGNQTTKGRIIAVTAAVVAAAVFHFAGGDELAEPFVWAMLGVLIVATVFGAPLFVTLAGAALVLFAGDGEPLASTADGIFRLTKEEVMPTIPLFTFAGAVLARSQASERLIRVFRAWLGWMPGGSAVVTAVLCAFFTTFTGASGVTILALGGLLFPLLMREAYSTRFSVGLLGASGSIGLLFPPSLPVILYATKAQVPVDRMFVAGLLPGALLVVGVALFGMVIALRNGVARQRFVFGEAWASLKGALGELLLPPIVIGCVFLGITSLVQAAAVTALYAILLEGFVYRDIRGWRAFSEVARETATLVGGVMLILGAAMGFSSYLVDAEIPALILDSVKESVQSKFVFLLALNAFLLVVGCLMDIYSAIIVVVPLILPIGAHFGIDPIHLGILFLANMELGFLTPPVGMNLFLTAYRLGRPLPEVYRAVLPFLLVLAIIVLLITYVSGLATWPVDMLLGPAAETPQIKF